MFKYLVPKEIDGCDEEIIFVFTAKYYNQQIPFFDYLRRRFKCKIVLKLTDKISSFSNFYGVDFNIIKTNFDFCCTYNEIDAKKYDLLIYPPIIENYNDINASQTTKTSDIFFVGKSKGRLEKLIKIYDICDSNGLTCDFHVIDVPKKEQIYRKGIIYNERLSYLENLKMAKQSKCILNIMQDNAGGITLRDYEAIGMNKYIITDNPYFSSSSFYKQTNVLDANNLQKEIYKIKSGVFENWQLTFDYSQEFFYIWLEKELHCLTKGIN